MRCEIVGQVIDVKGGTTKDGKPYSYALVYDGEDVVRIYGVDTDSMLIGSDCRFPVRLTIDKEKGNVYCRFRK